MGPSLLKRKNNNNEKVALCLPKSRRYNEKFGHVRDLKNTLRKIEL
jgi:hypothetical protein